MKRAICIGLPVAFVVVMAAACGESQADFGDFDTHSRDGSVVGNDAAATSGNVPTDANGDASSSSSSSSSSGDPDAETDADVVLPGLCRVLDSFGTSLPVPGLESVHGALAFSVTPDERLVTWLEAGDAGNVATVHLASRTSESATFGAATTLPIETAGYPGTAGVTISADGLRVAFTSIDGKQLGEVNRLSRDVGFNHNVVHSYYLLVEPTIGDADPKITFPAFGMGDHMLTIARRRPSDPAYSVLVSERATLDAAWPLPSARTESVLAVDETGSTQPKTVTGISVDGLTFFVRNESTNALFAVNRPNLGATFEAQYERPVAAATAAVPNADRARLYVLESGTMLVRTRNEE